MDKIYQFESVSEELKINPETCSLNELKHLIVEIQGRKNKLTTCFPISRFSQDAMQTRHEELVKCEKILRKRFS
jgi:hypothetical protein